MNLLDLLIKLKIPLWLVLTAALMGIVGITYYKYLLDKRLKILEYKLQSKRIHTEIAAKDQHEAYMRTWEALQQMNLCIQALWEKNSWDNAAALSNLLQPIFEKVSAWSILFEEEDLRELTRILSVIGEFRIGKGNLLKNWDGNDDFIPPYHQSDPHLREQIQENYALKEEFKRLLGKIETSFRQRSLGI